MNAAVPSTAMVRYDNNGRPVLATGSPAGRETGTP